jgi:hypothetical protein
MLKIFFEDPTSLLWLKFLISKLELYQECIKILQLENISIVEASEIGKLITKLENRRTCKVYTMAVKDLLSELEEQGVITLSQFSSSTDAFFIDCVEYMKRWTKHDEFKVFEWISLKKKPLWSEVEESMKILSKYKAFPEHFD